MGHIRRYRSILKFGRVAEGAGFEPHEPTEDRIPYLAKHGATIRIVLVYQAVMPTTITGKVDLSNYEFSAKQTSKQFECRLACQFHPHGD